MKNISQRVHDTRIALGMSQTKFSEKMGFSRDYVSKLEVGTSKNPSHRFLAQLEMLEKEAEYSASRGPDITNMPPHIPPPENRSVVQEPSLLYGACKGPTEVEYLAAATLLRELFERHPDLFRAAVGSVQGIYNSVKK